MVPLATNTALLTALAAVITAVAGLAVAIDTARRHRQSLRPVRKSLERLVELEAPPTSEVDSGFLLGSAEKRAEQDSIDTAIAGRAHGSEKLADVRRRLAESDVYALGSAAGDVSAPDEGAESEILHFTVEADGEDRVMMPVFTKPDIVEKALVRNPDWQKQSILEVNGGDLLDAVDDDVTLVINPWSNLEFQIPSKRLSPEPLEPPGSEPQR